MVAGKSTEELPQGWKEHIKVKDGKKIKSYTDPESGKKFYSKTGALRYINAKNDGNSSTPQRRTTRATEGSESKADASASGQEGSESKVDSKDCNVTPQPESTCVKEGSENKVDLGCDVTPQPQQPQPRSSRGKEVSESKANSGGAETNETPAWLPHGWTMEVKARGAGSRGGSTYKVYTDPSTGSKFYSKPEVTRYLAKLDQSKDETVKNTTVDKSLPKIDVSENQKTSKGDIVIYEQNTPSRITRRSSSKKDVSEDQKSSKDDSDTSKKEKSSSSKPSTEIVCAGVVESNLIDGLPAGWITEYRARSCTSGTKRDPYYTDPVSGYAFRSKKDVSRYLESGDIRKCAMRPKKRNEYNDSEFTKAVIAHTPSEKSLPKDVSEPLVSTKGQSSTSKKKQNSISKTSTDIVPYEVTGTPVVDELPPGWIKEIKTTKYGNSIRRDTYYIDPVSGYMFRSKKDVSRYLESGDINKCASRPKKMDPNDLDTTKDVGFDAPTDMKVEVPEQHQLTNGQSSRSKRKRNSISKPSTEDVPSTDIVPSAEIVPPTEVVSADLVEVTPADGLPQGWIKETKTTRNALGTRRDSSFTDPVSGYNFRSRKDALRYIETGDIKKCVLKPTKRDAKGPESTSFPSTPADKKYSLRSSRGQLPGGEKLNDGKGNLDVSSSTPLPLKAESSERKEVDNVGSVPAADAVVVTEPVTEVPEKKPRRGRKSRKTVQSSYSEFNGSNVSIDNMAAVSNAVTDHLDGEKTPKAKSTPKPRIGRKKSTDSKEPKKTPQSSSSRGRLSKRLAGSQPEMPNLQLSERSLRAAMKSCEEVDILSIINTNSLPNRGVSQPGPLDSGLASSGTPVTRFVEGERNIAPVETMKMVDEEIPGPLDTEPAKDVGDIVSMVVESISKFEVSDMNEEPPAEDETVPEQKLGEQEYEKRDSENPKTQNQQGTYQFLDSWSDPCLDFAFKTLTGTFAVNNNPSSLGGSQHQSSSSQRQSSSPQRQSSSSQRQSGSPQHQSSSSQRRSGSPQHQTGSSSLHQIGSSQHQTGSSSLHQIGSAPQHTGRPHHHTIPPQHHSVPPQHHSVLPQHQSGPPQRQIGSPKHHSGTFQHQTSTFQNQIGTYQQQTGTFQQQTASFQHQPGTFHHQTDTSSYIQRNEYFGQQSESQKPGMYHNSMPSHSNSLEQHVQVEQPPRTSPFFPETFSSPLYGGSGSQQHVQEEQWPRNLNSLPSTFSSPSFGAFGSQQHVQVDQMPRNEIPPGFNLQFGGAKPRDQTSIPPGFTLPFGGGKPRDQTSVPPGFNLPFGGGKPRDETSIPPGYSFAFGGAGSQQESSDSRNNNYQRNNDYK